MVLRSHRLPVLLALLSLLLAGCSLDRYNFIFNDNVVYSPNTALQDAVLRDAALQACLNQSLTKAGSEDLNGITLLACPSAGVETLVGIDALENLQQLELSDNAVSNLSPLGNLRNLRVLSLRNNRIGNVGVLESLPLLRFLALDGNNGIPCRQLDSLERKLGNTLSRPTGCAQ